MEGMEKSSNSSSSSSSSSARWNPTEQQVSVLEGLYRQGVRTPNAEQIHMITTKLREFGNIEAKNVFYWFQNHKARQRQRERQVTFNYYSSLLRRPPAPPPPPVICSPYYLTVPQYQPHPIHHAAAHTSSIAHFQRTMEMAREGSMETNNKVASPLRACHYNTMHVTMSTRSKEFTHATNSATFKQTLDLFPLHPTGILEDKLGSSITCASMEESDSLKEGEEEEAVGGDGLSKPLYDFFGVSHRSQ